MKHTLKEWRGRNPYLKTGKSQVGVFVFMLAAGRTKKTPKYVREYWAHGPMQGKEPEAYSGTYYAKEKQRRTRERQKDSTTKTLERKAKKVLRTINRSTGGER